MKLTVQLIWNVMKEYIQRKNPINAPSVVIAPLDQIICVDIIKYMEKYWLLYLIAHKGASKFVLEVFLLVLFLSRDWFQFVHLVVINLWIKEVFVVLICFIIAALFLEFIHKARRELLMSYWRVLSYLSMEMLYCSVELDLKYLDVIDVMMCVVSSCAFNVCLVLCILWLFARYDEIVNNNNNETPFLSHE